MRERGRGLKGCRAWCRACRPESSKIRRITKWGAKAYREMRQDTTDVHVSVHISMTNANTSTDTSSYA